MASQPLTVSTVNPLVRTAEYAVRGELVLRAMAHEEALRSTSADLPFEKLVYCNIGNPQSLQQAPVSFARQVLAMCDCPDLLDAGIFPADAVARARAYLAAVPSGTGAYTESQGIPIVRDEVAKFITERDGYAADPSQIFITDGASPAVQRMLQMIIAGPEVGVMIPIPQYPLYSAAICMMGGRQVGYLLDESNEWDMNVDELKRALYASRAEGTAVKALAVINPGNPTGQCLSDETMRAVVELCAEEGMLLMADEVYQENLWRRADRPWTSFKKVVCDMESEGSEAATRVQLASFHSVSKGFVGECGRRGGFVELHNIDEAVKAELYKLCSVSLCSNVPGQLMVGLMVNPPVEGDESCVASRAAPLLFPRSRDAASSPRPRPVRRRRRAHRAAHASPSPPPPRALARPSGTRSTLRSATRRSSRWSGARRNSPQRSTRSRGFRAMRRTARCTYFPP